MKPRKPRADERGLFSTELALMFPVFIAFFLMVLIAGQVVAHDIAVNNLADRAARAASFHTTLEGARTAAMQVVDLSGECDGGDLTDVTGFDAPALTDPGQLTVTVTCQHTVASFLGIGGVTRTAVGEADAVLDFFRSDGP